MPTLPGLRRPPSLDRFRSLFKSDGQSPAAIHRAFPDRPMGKQPEANVTYLAGNWEKTWENCESSTYKYLVVIFDSNDLAFEFDRIRPTHHPCPVVHSSQLNARCFLWVTELLWRVTELQSDQMSFTVPLGSLFICYPPGNYHITFPFKHFGVDNFLFPKVTRHGVSYLKTERSLQ